MSGEESRIRRREIMLKNQRLRREEKAAEKNALAALVVNPRHCPTCNTVKERSEFSSYEIKGVRYWHHRCIRCRATQYLRSKTCKSKRALIRSLLDKPCADCGQKFPPEGMVFVPVSGRSSFSLLAAWTGRSPDKIRAEAERHLVVCATCKRIRDFNHRSRKRPDRSKLAELPPELRAQVRVDLTSPTASSVA